jgi:hypothetical protein
MTATTTAMPQDLASRTWSSLLRLAAVVAVLVVLAIGSFAVGRTTADDAGGGKAAVVPTASPAPPAAVDCVRLTHTPDC